MRNSFSIWACLFIFSLNLSAFNEREPEKTQVSNPENLEILETIPDRTLEIEVQREFLQIQLSGHPQSLHWILYHPKGKVISRISTESNIDAIDISTLEKGNYVLMIKDDKGRILHKTFTRR